VSSNRPAIRADSTAMMAVAHSLSRECEAVESFTALLDDERSVLLQRDAGMLSAVTERKAQATRRIAGLVEARNQALTAAGYPTGRAGILAFVESHPQSKGIWARLEGAATRTQGLNRTVGQLIGWRLAATDQALSVLRGAQAPLYAANGQPAPAYGARRLASA